tara:strand:- start:48863 stop:49009 length:147 start_codon:yes stop_codon:yes gene_type:complete
LSGLLELFFWTALAEQKKATSEDPATPERGAASLKIKKVRQKPNLFQI